MATPAKALADLVHLVPGADASAYLSELRLQNLERMDPAELLAHPILGGRPKIRRALKHLAALSEERA